MANSAQTSIGVALGTAALVGVIYQSVMPPVANVRAAQANNATLQKSRRTATFLAAGTVGLVYWLTKDPVPVMIAGSEVIALDMTHRHADAVNHITQTVMPASSGAGPSSGAQSSGIHGSAAQGS
jgi:hypothetical protein